MLFGNAIHIAADRDDSSLRFAIRTSKGITLSVFYPIQLSKNRLPPKGPSFCRTLRSVSSGMFPNAYRTSNPFRLTRTPVTSRVLGLERTKLPGPRSAADAPRTEVTEPGEPLFQPAILHKSLCTLALDHLAFREPPSRTGTPDNDSPPDRIPGMAGPAIGLVRCLVALTRWFIGLMRFRIRPCDFASGTCDLASDPCDLASDPCDLASGPCDLASDPCDLASGPCDFASGPCDFASGKCDLASDPCDLASDPCDLASGPCDFASGPCDLASDPCDLASGPCDFASDSCDVPSDS
jgi:hypothetical protein